MSEVNHRKCYFVEILNNKNQKPTWLHLEKRVYMYNYPNSNALNHFKKYSGMLIMIDILCRFGLILCILLNFFVFTGSVHMVWMAPYNVPDSSLGVNASTSVPALALALQKIYNQGILANNSVRYYGLYLLFYTKQCNI